MIKIGIDKRLGFMINPYQEEEQRLAMINLLPPKSKLAFVDLAPTKEIISFIQAAESRGHRLAVFMDHHLDILHEDELAGVEWLRKKKGEINIVPYGSVTSACQMVKYLEWDRKNVHAVFFHSGVGGCLSFFRGCGISYPGMVADANIFAGAAKGSPSRNGILLVEAYNYIGPYYRQDLAGYEAAKVLVCQGFGGCLRNNFTGPDAERFVNMVAAEAKLAKDNAFNFVRNTELLEGNVALADFRPIINSGGKIAVSLWKKRVLEKFENALVCSIGIGHLGEQVYIFLPRPLQDKYDLLKCLPPEVEGRVSFQAQVPLGLWPEFLNNWREGRAVL